MCKRDPDLGNVKSDCRIRALALVMSGTVYQKAFVAYNTGLRTCRNECGTHTESFMALANIIDIEQPAILPPPTRVIELEKSTPRLNAIGAECF